MGAIERLGILLGECFEGFLGTSVSRSWRDVVEGIRTCAIFTSRHPSLVTWRFELKCSSVKLMAAIDTRAWRRSSRCGQCAFLVSNDAKAPNKPAATTTSPSFLVHSTPTSALSWHPAQIYDSISNDDETAMTA